MGTSRGTDHPRVAFRSKLGEQRPPARGGLEAWHRSIWCAMAFQTTWRGRSSIQERTLLLRGLSSFSVVSRSRAITEGAALEVTSTAGLRER